MKLSDIKGEVAVEVDELLSIKFNDYLEEFILSLPEKYNVIKQGYEKGGTIGLLDRMKGEIKDFVSAKGPRRFFRFFYYEYNSLQEKEKVVRAMGGANVIENAVFTNKYFSGDIKFEFNICKNYPDFCKAEFDVELEVINKDLLLSDLEIEIGGTTQPTLKDARGVDIKVGDIVAEYEDRVGMKLARVVKLMDLQIKIENEYRQINKYPKDVVIVSREVITSIK